MSCLIGETVLQSRFLGFGGRDVHCWRNTNTGVVGLGRVSDGVDVEQSISENKR
jgi:hypothetical protein